MMGMLEVTNVSHHYQFTPIFDRFSFSVPAGAITGIVGANGIGKTTLLNLCAGILHPSQGSICLHGVPTKKLRLSYLFQNDRESLLPWLTVRDNIALHALIRGAKRQERERIASKLCAQSGVRLDLARYPYQLSGGQQQMVCILRGFALCPDLLLLDEPFSALDREIKKQMVAFFRRVWKQTRPTCLLVSHDHEEVRALAHHLITLGGSPASIIKQETLTPHL